MGRRIGNWNEHKVALRIQQGYGRGSGASYVPWIGVRDISSIGTSTRLWSPKVGRTLQFLSNIERDAFLTAEFKKNFVDYWEQFPLERSYTMDAATALGVRHPQYVGTRIPTVMTLDGVLTVAGASGLDRSGIECKHSDSLLDSRTLEKLSVSKLTCARLDLPHVLVTEKSMPRPYVNNILWVRMALPRTGEVEPVQGAFDKVPTQMWKHLSRHQFDVEYALMPLSTYCGLFDELSVAPRGFGLRCMKLLMWDHRVEFNLNCKRPADIPLGQLKVQSPGTSGEA